MNPSARLAAIAAALKFTHPGASLALLGLVVAVQRLEHTLDEIAADAMEQSDLDAEAAARVGFSSRHQEAMGTLRQAATLSSAPPAWFNRPEYPPGA